MTCLLVRNEYKKLKDDVVTSVLIGASKPQQILDNIKVIESAGFTDEEIRMIDEISGN